MIDFEKKDNLYERGLMLSDAVSALQEVGDEWPETLQDENYGYEKLILRSYMWNQLNYTIC